MNLNIGCGKRYLAGWTNIDIDPEVKADFHTPAHDLSMFPDESMDRIMAIHLFEHMYLWEVDSALSEWARVLRPGGELVLEMPDIVKAAKNLLAGLNDQQAMWPLYGDPTLKNSHMIHRWGWHPASLKAKLKEHGFTKFREETTQYHGAGRKHRDMRIVGVRV